MTTPQSNTLPAPKPSSQAIVELKNISRVYDPKSVAAVNNISLTLKRGEIMALLGASGCGKTTTLRLIAGLEAPDHGEIWLNGQRAAGHGTWVPPEKRSIGLVFQDFALFPHLTVNDNVAFPLNRRPAVERATLVKDMLALVGLEAYGQRYPHQLSGGQQQRVALARALAAQPAVVLLDEPFSNLDAALRQQVREDMKTVLRKVNATTLFVTHDQEEALSLADTVVVMQRGQIGQIGTPQEIYLRSASRSIAEFVGDANFLRGEADGKVVICALGTLPLATPAKGMVEVLIRPERLFLQPNPKGNGVVQYTTFYGHDQLVHVRMGDLNIRARTFPRLDLVPNAQVQVMVFGPVMAYVV
jgi:iron(III) transport system ATP-binding protein